MNPPGSVPDPPGQETPPRAALISVLDSAQALGFVGPGPVADHLAHAEAHARVLAGVNPGPNVCDLGSGAGLPGLVIAALDLRQRVVLVESMAKRCRFLADATKHLRLTPNRAEVWCGRAEDFARERGETADAVVARSFAPPAVTAEIAAGILRVGGALVASSGPESRTGWDSPDGLWSLGLTPPRFVQEGGRTFAVVTKIQQLPEGFPRRSGVPAKRPLW